MAAGKNKLITGCRLYHGGYDLSGDVMGIGNILNSVGEVPLTGWSDTTKTALGDGQRTLGIMGFQCYMNDDTGKSATAIKAMPTATATGLFIGDAGAAPAANNIAYILPPLQLGDQSSFAGGAGIFTADFVPDQYQQSANYKTPWGRVLMPLTSISASTDGTVVNFGTDGAAGASAVLFVTATSSGDFAFVIEHSNTGVWGGEEATLITFSIDGSAVNSDFGTASGAIQQYVRLAATRTAGTVSVACAIALNGLA